MNVLAFNIELSPESNDHQTRIIIDGNDWLGKNYLGLDPPEFFRQKTLFENGELIIGRCDCGVVGYDAVQINTIFSENEVFWVNANEKLSFDKEKFLKLIETASLDFSWEDLGRKVERLVSKIFIGKPNVQLFLLKNRMISHRVAMK